jgi:hypothetical protein
MRKTFLFICTLTSMAAMAAEDLASRKVGIAPSAADTPQIEFAFEERVTIDPAVVLGDTDFGHRQYIPITGGTVAGPKLTLEIEEPKAQPGGGPPKIEAVRIRFYLVK